MINENKILSEKFNVQFRDELTKQQEVEYVGILFEEYEKIGFETVFHSNGGDFVEYDRKHFKVLGRESQPDFDIGMLPVWKIQFEDGKTIYAYPDEIVVSKVIK